MKLMTASILEHKEMEEDDFVLVDQEELMPGPTGPDGIRGPVGKCSCRLDASLAEALKKDIEGLLNTFPEEDRKRLRYVDVLLLPSSYQLPFQGKEGVPGPPGRDCSNNCMSELRDLMDVHGPASLINDDIEKVLRQSRVNELILQASKEEKKEQKNEQKKEESRQYKEGPRGNPGAQGPDAGGRTLLTREVFRIVDEWARKSIQ